MKFKKKNCPNLEKQKWTNQEAIHEVLFMSRELPPGHICAGNLPKGLWSLLTQESFSHWAS
jgi:hypothetical protein